MRPPLAHHFRQSQLQRALRGRPAAPLHLLPEILHQNPVLNGGLADAHFHLGQAVADFLHPVVLAQEAERLADGFVEGVGCHFDGVFVAGEVETGDEAGSECHGIIVADSLFVRHCGI
jgi:hypothetical protein